MMSVGYSRGVKTVYDTHLKEQDPIDFPDFAKGNVDEQVQALM